MKNKVKGCTNFRQRILLATITGQALRIDDIRSDEVSPGLRDFEASFLRMIESVTNGCAIDINETGEQATRMAAATPCKLTSLIESSGTSLRYKPGMIVGGMTQHECSTSRSIGYFIEPLLLLGLFGKKPLNITLRGVTNDELDPTVDTIRTVTLPLLKRLLGEDIEGLELKVAKRGARPLGGGEVVLRVPVLRQLPPVNLTDEGMIKRIRGVSYSMKVSPQNTNRMVDGARGILNRLLADVFIFTDAVSGASSGLSPGYGLTLVAETTSGCLISAECCATSTSSSQSLKSVVQDSAFDEPLLVPEDIGKMAAQVLLEEINRGGVVDGSHQALVLILAALGPEEVNQVRLGPLTPHAVRTLRTLRDFLGITFSLKAETESRTIFLTCIGSGTKNMSKKVT